MNKLNFCTLFDSNYLARGLVMYESLLEQCSDFHLYVFAFNDSCYKVLSELALEKITVIPLIDFEDEALLAVKPKRSRAEYCWTSTSSTLVYCIEKFQLDHCIYIDADMYFYANPKEIIKSLNPETEALITPHNYTPWYDQSRLRGKYCVQFMYFKATPCGLSVLQQWRKDCLDWCYAKPEEGKFGDQKYLDSWLSDYDCVEESIHPGIGLAPWNCQQYSFTKENDNSIKIIKAEEKYPLYFFHFHGLKVFDEKRAVFAPRSYVLSKQVREYFYKPYFNKLIQKEQELENQFPGINANGRMKKKDFRREKYFQGHVAWFKRNIFKRYFGSVSN